MVAVRVVRLFNNIVLHDPAGDGGVAHAGAALTDGAGCRPKAAERNAGPCKAARHGER